MPKGPPIITIDVKNFALVTHAVPAARVRARLPAAYRLETHRGEHDDELALVTATCFCNENFRPARLGWPRHTFNETTYRTYVTHEGRRGIYFFGRFLGTRLARSAQRPMAKDTFLGDFDVAISRGPAGYDSYSCELGSPHGDTRFTLQALDEPTAVGPFESADEHVQFLTYRLHGFYSMPLGVQGHMPVGHPRMGPVQGTLSSGRFDLWAALGILEPHEVLRTFSVLVVPEVRFRLYAPRPLV